nr:hypothetical protein [uncultured Methanoregula sp.]
MKIHPFAAMLFSCLLVTSIMMPAEAHLGSRSERNGSTGSSNLTTRHIGDGDWFELWRDENKTLQCTGLNNKGQCDIPPGLADVKSVNGGSDFVVALLNNGSVVVWGSNEHGQRNVPPNLTTVVRIATISDSVAALLENGTVITWGNNDKGRIEVPPVLANNVTSISGGNSHFVALTREGIVVAWGDNALGQCNVPTGMGKIIRMTTGGYHTLALAENGTLFAWGWNWWGQCDIPPNIGKVRTISAGRSYSLAHLENGSVLVFGSPVTSAGEPGPGLYPSIADTNFNAGNPWDHDHIAITEIGEKLVWTWDPQNLDVLIPENSDITFRSSNRGTFNLKRVCDKDLLDQRNRSLIYANIYANPGIHFNDLCRALEINRGTMSYHLAVLLSSGKIVGMEYAGKTVYFSTKGCFEDAERKLLTHLKNPARMRLLYHLHTHGSLRRGDLIDKTRLSAAAAAWHLKSLSDERIVQIKKTGREAYYSLHPETASHMSGLMAAVSEVGGRSEGSAKRGSMVIG